MTGMVDINSLYALTGAQNDYHAYAAAAFFFKTPDYAAAAIDLNIVFSADNIGGQ